MYIYTYMYLRIYEYVCAGGGGREFRGEAEIGRRGICEIRFGQACVCQMRAVPSLP